MTEGGWGCTCIVSLIHSLQLIDERQMIISRYLLPHPICVVSFHDNNLLVFPCFQVNKSIYNNLFFNEGLNILSLPGCS